MGGEAGPLLGKPVVTNKLNGTEYVCWFYIMAYIYDLLEFCAIGLGN